MKRMVALAASFGLIMAVALSVNAASLATDQATAKKPLLNAGAQPFRDAMKWGSNIQPQNHRP